MVISNWVEKKLLGDNPEVKPKRRSKNGWEKDTWKAGFIQGFREGIEQERREAFEEGRAYERAFQDGFRKGREYERERMADEGNGDGSAERRNG